MVRRASNASVSEIQVEVDTPADRTRKRDNIRSNTGSQAISGSGATGTLKSNSSSGDWYLETVTGYALSLTAAGTVAIQIHVKDENGSVKSQLAADVYGGFELNFAGVKVKPGWDIDYTIEQDDASSYTIELSPLIRKPNPDEPQTVTTTDVIDSFEDADISEYSGDTGNFTTVSTDSYHLDNSLQYSNAANSNILSTTGLGNYPEKGQTFEWHMKSTSLDSADDPVAGMMFGVEDSNNFYVARVNYDDRKILFTETDGGSSTTVATSSLGSGFKADRWDLCRVEWGDTVTFTMVNTTDDSTMASLSTSFSDFSTQRNNGGMGWYGSVENGETIRYDNAVIG